MQDVEETVTRYFSPDEPIPRGGTIAACDVAAFQDRTWATRKNLWVDRVASAWLIRRFIDRGAQFHWLDHPNDLCEGEVGFDFDGAQFSHVGTRVTFEVLLRGFRLNADAALGKLSRVVHYLDVGGTDLPEAAGLVAMLEGARHQGGNDDAFLATASILFDTLYACYGKGE